MELTENLGGLDMVCDLPAGGNAGAHHHQVHVTARLLPHGHEAAFHLPSNALLLEMLEEGARHLHVHLLPPSPQQPLDLLHDFGKHGHVGPPITDLEESLGAHLKGKGTTPHFGIELVLAFRVKHAVGGGAESRHDPEGDTEFAGDQP